MSFRPLKPIPSAEPLPAGRFDPREEVKALSARGENLLVAVVLFLAVALSSLWIPTIGWASSGLAAETQAGKGVRGESLLVRRACAGQVWGRVSADCGTAVASAGGRRIGSRLRVIEGL